MGRLAARTVLSDHCLGLIRLVTITDAFLQFKDFVGRIFKEHMMRKSLILGAMVVLAAFIGGTGVGDEAENNDEFDKQITKLQLARRDTYAKLVDVQKTRFSHGIGTMTDVLNASIMLTEAELQIAKNNAERIKHIQNLVKSTKHLEEDAEQRVKVGARSVEQLLLARTARMAAEIRLLKEKKAQQ